MHSYCIHELHLSDAAAFKRIRAARAAREYPAFRAALADGRLHLSAVVVLAPSLRPENAEELLAAAVHKTKAEVELMLAHRFQNETWRLECERFLHARARREPHSSRGSSAVFEQQTR